jgi:stage III sporulation protein AH
LKKIFHKNQLIITTLAFLIAIAGYVSYDRVNSTEEETVKEANADAVEDDYVVDNNTYDIYEEEGEVADADADTVPTDAETASADEGTVLADGEEVALSDETDAGTDDDEEILNAGETILTGLTIGNSDYAAEVKLNREQVRSKNKEALLEIINNEAISEKQKQEALDAMVEMTDIAQKEADAEMLLEAKGFTNVVVSISDDTCDVVLDMGDVTDAKRAQVEDIVKRKTEISAENIIITPIHITDEE